MSRRCREAFSLVEMLVGVSIVAVLASLLLPAFKTVSDRALRIQCGGNLHQIGIGLFAYAAEHNNFLPVTLGSTGYQQDSWGYAVWPYVYGNYDTYLYPNNCLQMGTPVYPVCMPNIFRCPATKAKAVKLPSASSISSALYSYGLNSSPLGRNYGLNRGQPIPLTAVVHRSLAAMVLESSFPIADNTGFISQTGLIPHGGCAQVLYYDGHIDLLPPSRIPTSPADTFWDGH